MAKGYFKTGYNQREKVLELKVTAALEVGDLVKENSGALAAATNLTDAQYIVAQSDQTMGDGHIPVEKRDYRYSKSVAASTTAKRVAVYEIIDKNDIIVG